VVVRGLDGSVAVGGESKGGRVGLGSGRPDLRRGRAAGRRERGAPRTSPSWTCCPDPEATVRITAVDGAPAVIVMTTFDTEAHLLEALRQGASGFLLKDTEPERIVEAVRRAAAGEPALSASITRRLMHRVRDQTRSQVRAKERLGVLSPREVQIARAIARGRSNGEIAAELFISLGTVKSHISQILAKLELTGRVGISLLVLEAEAAAGNPPSV
jgi:DNA-binding NarL/FixJ family response regulator